jgi:hypothetical protein
MKYSKPKKTFLTEDNKEVSKSSETSSPRMAIHHQFIIANMFGPVDWAIVSMAEETEEPIPKRSYWLVDANMFGPLDWAMDMESKIEAEERGIGLMKSAAKLR